MRKQNLKSEIHFRENFPYADFIFEEVNHEIITEILNKLKPKFDVYERKVVLKDRETLESAVILKDSQLIGAIHVNNESSMYEEKFIRVTLFYSPTEDGEELFKLVKKYARKRTISSKYVKLILFGRWGRNTEYLISPEELLDPLTPELFYGIDVENLSESFLKSPQSILLIFGEPGTGKSKLIQYILGKSPQVFRRKVNVLIMKGIENIKDSADSISVYLDNDIVVLDDFDFVSLKRDGNDEISSVISTILSATDGFLPKRAKIIISTNKTFKEIDPALLRPSRLFDVLELKPIPKEHFENVCKKYPQLSPGLKAFNGKRELKVAEILDFITRSKTVKNYLKDSSVSKKEWKHFQKIGF